MVRDRGLETGLTVSYAFCGQIVGSIAQKQTKLLIYVGKRVVGGTGLEAIPRVSYLVIKCHIH